MGRRLSARSTGLALWAGLGALLIVVGLAPTAAAPLAPTASTRVAMTGVAYAPAEPAENKGHLLDLYLPPHRKHRAPLVIWSRGSAWTADNGRFGAEAVAARLNPRGYAVAGVSVRSSTVAKFPSQLHDVKAAVRYLRANAGRYHLDPHRFAIMGDSSGGWVAAMTAMTGDMPTLEGAVGVVGPSSRVQAAIPIYAPTDFLRVDDFAPKPCRAVVTDFTVGDCHTDARSPESKLLGCQVTVCHDAVTRASPVTYAAHNVPPMLLLHGQQDILVPWQQSQLLYEALRKSCRDVTMVLLPRPGHGVWKRFLTDPELRAGATIESSQRCRSQAARPIRLDWNYLVRFLDRALRR